MALARHTRDRVDRGDLDDDVVRSIPIPVLFGVSYGDLVSDFGDPRGGGTRLHEGQDMITTQGAPIVSPTEAIVLSVGTGVSAGNFVYTANPGGETFRYMHLQDTADFKRGDTLKTGDYIGTVGDTGNAAPGSYHLHFEIRDDRNRATDPYPRLDGAFSDREIERALESIFSDRSDDEAYAAFLAREYGDAIATLVKSGEDIPNVLEDELDDSGVIDQIEAEERIREVLAPVPKILFRDLGVGDTGPEVQLLQLYLMFYASGDSVERLAAVGPTGYYGSITANALSDYQAQLSIVSTGVYDTQTREFLND